MTDTTGGNRVMDDNRIVTGMAGESGPQGRVEQTDGLRNDLEDSGGVAYQRQRRRRRQDEDSRSRVPDRPPIVDEPATDLIQNLDRLRNTDQEAEAEITDVRRAAGQHYYREKDPETTRFYRRQKRAQSPTPKQANETALEEKSDDSESP